MNRLLNATAVALLAASATGAEGQPGALASLCVAVGLCDRPMPPALVVDVLCDLSENSTCSPETLGETVNTVVDRIGKRPGSQLRFWELGRRLADTRIVASLDVPASTGPGRRLEQKRLQAFVSEAARLAPEVSSRIFASRLRGRSPIAEGIGAIALTRPQGFDWRLIVLSDLREVSSFGDFECGPLPSAAKFADVLFRNRVLSPGALQGAVVTFAHAALAPVRDRNCVVSLERTSMIREAWRTALTRAGSKSAEFLIGPFVWNEEEN